jgi:small subunit ribosomal protein S20
VPLVEVLEEYKKPGGGDIAPIMQSLNFWRKQVANIKSQIKRNRQNDKRRLRNRVFRGTARVAVKSARTAIDAGVPESKAALTAAISELDKAVERGVLHKNNAARRKSRLMLALARMEPARVEPEAVATVPVVEPEEKKPSPRRRAAKAEPKAEAAAEPKAEKTSSPKGKKAAATSSPKGRKAPAKTTPKVKKPAAAAKKPAAKK